MQDHESCDENVLHQLLEYIHICTVITEKLFIKKSVDHSLVKLMIAEINITNVLVF